MRTRHVLMTLSLGLSLVNSAAAGFPFGFVRWSGFGYGPGIHAYHCCPTCAPPSHYQGGWVPYGAPMLLEPTPAPLERPTLSPAPAREPLPGPVAIRPTGWATAGASLR